MSKTAKKLNILHKSGRTVFSTQELMLYWAVENKRVLYTQIARFKEQGFLRTIQRGLYALEGVGVNEFELAGKLKKNSYISFETVLAKNGIINQWYGIYFSASDRKLFVENDYGKFDYRRLTTKVLNNRLGVVNQGSYFIASTERAICDYFYEVGFQQLDDLDGVDKTKLLKISKIYKNKRLEKDINKLIKLI
jgi:predicted transcriptional regulator of viral defense system